MTVLADAAQFAEEIDAAKTQEDLRLDEEYILADADRRWAETRLALASAKA